MIINTGSRTDTVQYYSDWLLKRFEEGFVYSRNPMFQNKVTKYELDPKVLDCVVFCSKNYEPILNRLTEITDKFNTYFHYTITAYGKDIEPNVPSIDESIETLIKLSKIVDKQRIAWRYDPILLTEKYTKNVHYETFDYMSEKLSPYIDRCIFSFVEMYKKLRTNMPEIITLTDVDKNEIAKNIGAIAKKHNIIIQTCATVENIEQYGILQSGCMTSEILGKANDLTFKKVRHSGNRQGCRCMENRNIGDYDTCPNGCKYCYANKNPQIAQENYRKHNPNDLMILGKIQEELESNQKATTYKHSNPTISDILYLDRMDSSLYSEGFKIKEHLIVNYINGTSTIKELGFDISRGQNLQISNIGKSIQTDVHFSNYYTLVYPKFLTKYGTIAKKVYLGNPNKLKTLKLGDIIFGAEGNEKGRSIVVIEEQDNYITNIHGITLNSNNHDMQKSVFIKLMLDYLRDKSMIDAYAVGGNGGSLAIKYWDTLKFPNLKKDKEKEIVRLYHNSEVIYNSKEWKNGSFLEKDNEFNKFAGICEIDKSMKYLQEKLNNAIDNIANDKLVDTVF